MKMTIRTICTLVLAVLACMIVPPTATAEQSNLISIADNIPAIPNGSISVPVVTSDVYAAIRMPPTLAGGGGL